MGKLLDENSLLAIKTFVEGSIQGALTPELVGTETSGEVTWGDGNTNNGFRFTLAEGIPSSELSSVWGLYIFTYGNCMIMIPLYGAQSSVAYAVSAALVGSGGSYQVKVLRYEMLNYDDMHGGRDIKLQFFERNDFIPTGYTGYLFKVKLY